MKRSDKSTWRLWKISTVAKEGKCWYLPHHGEKQASKLGKIRVFFDLRADFNGALINKACLDLIWQVT